jgi:hypothetical protein
MSEREPESMKRDLARVFGTFGDTKVQKELMFV